MPQRKIIHIDMDAFFAAVEQRDHPQYRGQPVVVGGAPNSRGVVATASYEARAFGIHSAMPTAHAKRLCPDAIFIRPRFREYQQVSTQIHSIFNDYSDKVESLSLDEAYLDVSDCPMFEHSATRIAIDIRQSIITATGLSASAGISYNKFLAKLASDINKPNGQYVILPEHGEEFVAKLPIGGFHGIGKATEIKMHDLGVRTGADLKRLTLAELTEKFGKQGRYYYHLARGVDHREVQSERIRKSLGAETTFATDLRDRDRMLTELEKLADGVFASLRQKDLSAQTVAIKIKYSDFQTITRSLQLSRPINDTQHLGPWLHQLLKRTDVEMRAVRLLGVSASRLQPINTNSPRQVELDL